MLDAMTDTKQRQGSPFADVKVTCDLIGSASIVINGTDVADQVRATQIITRAGEPTIVVTELIASATVFEGPGIVQVIPSPDGQAKLVAETVQDFLDDINPEGLEAAALEQCAPNESVIKAALRVLREQAGAA